MGHTCPARLYPARSPGTVRGAERRQIREETGILQHSLLVNVSSFSLENRQTFDPSRQNQK